MEEVDKGWREDEVFAVLEIECKCELVCGGIDACVLDDIL